MDDARCRNFFLDADSTTYHRQYEVLRAVFVDGLSQHEAADKYGYTYGSMRQLVHGFRTAFRTGAVPPFFNTPRSVGHRPGLERTTRRSRNRPRSPTSEPAPSRR